jgi:hypothetical protein
VIESDDGRDGEAADTAVRAIVRSRHDIGNPQPIVAAAHDGAMTKAASCEGADRGDC